MRKFLAVSILSFAALFMAGCPTATSPTPPLAPGYGSQADQQMGEILAGAHAFYQSIQQQSLAGTMVLTPVEKQAFNTFAITLNGAQTVYLAYHGNPTAANLATAQAAVNNVQTQQAALPLPQVTK